VDRTGATVLKTARTTGPHPPPWASRDYTEPATASFGTFPGPEVTAAIAIGVGMLLRLVGIGYGLPFAYLPDELFLVGPALRMVASGDLNPRFWDYPTFQIYSLMVLYALRDLVARVIPQAAAPGSELLIGRLLNVVYGTTTLLVTYQVGRRLFGAWAGAAAAALLATSYLHNVASHTLKVDAPATFFAALTLAASVALVARPSWAIYAAAGAAVGLATAGKYPAATVCVVVVTAHAVAWRREALVRLPRLVLAGVCSIGVFLLTSPYLIVDSGTFTRELDVSVVQWAATGHEGSEGNVVVTYLGWLFAGPEAPMAWLAALAVGLGAWRRDWRVGLVAVFPLVFLVELAGWAIRFQTYLLPILPFVAVLGGHGVVQVWRLASRDRARSVAWVVLLTLGLGYQLIGAARYSQLLTAEDARTTALRWIEANVPPGSRLVREGYTPHVPADRYRVTELWRAIDQDPSWYRAEYVDYVVLGNLMYGRFYADPARYAEQVAKYDRLLGQVELVKRIEGPMQGVPDGKVDIYRLKP
jgi:4-amino-4-deoxy-L-arabinose transferase-like glycosyltransferase